MLILIILLSLVLITPCATLEEYGVSVPGVNTMGDFENARFWQRLNKTQAYVFPTYSYYYDEVIGELATKISYIPVNSPQYILTSEIYEDGEYPAYLDRLSSLYWYESENKSDSELAMQGAMIIDDMVSVDRYNGYIKYHYSSALQGPDLGKLNILLVGDVYSYNVEHQFEGQPNNVDITGLIITNPAEATTPCVVYLNGTMKWAGLMSKGEIPHGEIAIDSYVMLQPGYSVRIDETLLEGDAGRSAVMTCFSGQLMIRHGNGFTVPAEFCEEYNDYFSQCVSYSDTNLVGLYYGDDDKYGGHTIESAFNAQYWGTFTELPDYGQLNINHNGVYSTKYYSSVKVEVPQEVSWRGMFDWLIDSAGAFMTFEIAPGWTIGIILTFIVGLSVALWAIKVFMGG